MPIINSPNAFGWGGNPSLDSKAIRHTNIIDCRYYFINIKWAAIRIRRKERKEEPRVIGLGFFLIGLKAKTYSSENSS
jgi:hypothetical protein